jgi:hypothetical protein
MTDFSGYSEDEILEHIFKNTSIFSSPSNVYVSLHTADEGENPDGSNEVGAADYSRVSTAPADWTVDANDGPSTVDNANVISFGDPQNNWGTITHVAIWYASTGGNPLTATFALNSSKTVDADTDEFTFEVGDLNFELD